MFAALIRFSYMNGFLNGDEAGVVLLQASGQADRYQQGLPQEVITLEFLKKYITYSPDYGPHEIVSSLRYAGMHPPLYHILLNTITRFAGTSVLVLRLLSLICSLGSIILLFMLGRRWGKEGVAFYAALLFAISSYGLMYSTTVRPYPLAMVLALAGTVLAWDIVTEKQWRLTDTRMYAYAFIALLGLYTTYQFVFVVLSNVIFFIVSDYHSKKMWRAVILIGSIITIGFLPWLPMLWDQLQAVTKNQYYFHHLASLFDIGYMLTSANLIGFRFAFAWFVIVTLFFYTSIMLGIMYAWKSKKIRVFLLSFFLYLVIYYLTERVLGMSSLVNIRFMFFLMPITFLIISYGLVHESRGTIIRITLGYFIICMFAVHSYWVWQYRPRLGVSERYISEFSREIESSRNTPGKRLMIIDTDERRYLLPLVHALHAPLDIFIVSNEDDNDVGLLSGLSSYKIIYIVSLEVDYDTAARFTAETFTAVEDEIKKYNFMRSKEIHHDMPHARRDLYVYSLSLEQNL